MTDRPTYAVIGSGAVGMYYGGCLQRLGREVHFLCHRDYKHVAKNGIRVDSVNGNFTLPRVNAYVDVRNMPCCDVVIVALKTTSNHHLPHLLPPVVADHTLVLVLQNGLGIEQQVGEIVGHDRVLGGLCFVCSHKIGPGHVRHIDYGRVEFGEHTADGSPGGITDRMRIIARDFEQAGNPVVLSDDLILARWKKLVWNVPFNGLSVVEDKDTATIMATPALRQKAHQLMCEVQAAAMAADGREIGDDFIEMMMDWTDRMEPYLPSMKLDFDAGRPMEVEAIFGAPVRAAKSAGCPVPAMSAMYEALTRLSGNVAGNPSTD